MNKENIHAAVTSDSVTLFWEQDAPRKYIVELNGAAVSTEKTHLTLDGLKPETDYQAVVRTESAALGTCAFRTAAKRNRLNVREFGAVGDGVTMDTHAIQKAIDRCDAADEVYFPSGTYRTGALRLHSNMALYLDQDAVLQGTASPEDYLPRIRSRFEGTEMECYSSLLNMGELDHTTGPNCENILIYGKGTIASGGRELAGRVIETERERLKDYLAANAELVGSCENSDTIPGRVRPRLINLSNCRNIRISGLTLRDGASWNVHMVYCEDILTDHCVFISQGIWNGDGWDPDSSERCTLFACRFLTGDDAVAIKSGKNPEGNQIARPCRGIRVFDCVSEFGHGISIGSEISGGIEDIRIWDCDLSASGCGLQIKGTKKRGGYVRGVQVQDCVLPCILVHEVTYNDDGIGAPTPPQFENYRFERLTLTGRALPLMGGGAWEDVSPIDLSGFHVPGHELRDVVIRDCAITGGGPLRLGLCSGITIENLAVAEYKEEE